jgi:hypothetical protein
VGANLSHALRRGALAQQRDRRVAGNQVQKAESKERDSKKNRDDREDALHPVLEHLLLSAESSHM